MNSVYQLLNANGEVIYIGCAMDVDARIRHHRTVQPWADEIAHVEILAEFDARDDALRCEAFLIGSGRPRHNVQHNPDRSTYTWTDGPGYQIVTTRIPLGVRERIDALAARTGSNRARVLCQAIEAGLPLIDVEAVA